MPQVFTNVNFAVFTVWRRGQQCFDFFFPTFVGVVTQDMNRFSTHFQQEFGHAEYEVCIAVQAEFFTVQPCVGVGHHVNQATAFQQQFVGNRFACYFRNLHQEFVSPVQTHWDVDFRRGVFPSVLYKLLGFF